MNKISFSAVIIALSLTATLLPISGASAASHQSPGLFDAPVSAAELDKTRGTGSPVIIDTTFSGNDSGNIVIGGVTGDNNLSGTSFSNAQGVINVIQNSGNNVLIQSSTTVNMSMH